MPANLEIVRDQYAATNERDFARAMAHYDADVVLIVPDGFVDPGTYHGRDAVGAWFGDWFRSFDRDARFELTELHELDGGEVLLVADHHARGRGSGVVVRATLVWVYGVRGGKIVRVEGHATRADALEALGLEED
jgi:ketosteroid isomerase-like protein